MMVWGGDGVPQDLSRGRAKIEEPKTIPEDIAREIEKVLVSLAQ